MAQSQGYKRFLSSINSNDHGTSTPQPFKNKIYPCSSTPNIRSIPVLSVKTKVHKKRCSRISINHIILISEGESCYCKKSKIYIF